MAAPGSRQNGVFGEFDVFRRAVLPGVGLEGNAGGFQTAGYETAGLAQSQPGIQKSGQPDVRKVRGGCVSHKGAQWNRVGKSQVCLWGNRRQGGDDFGQLIGQALVFPEERLVPGFGLLVEVLEGGERFGEGKALQLAELEQILPRGG